MTNDKEKEYKILINKNAVPVLIPSSDNSDPDTWFDLADESKHIAFKDEGHVKKIILKEFYKGRNTAFNYTFTKGEIFDLPQNISVSFDWSTCENDICLCTYFEKSDCGYTRKLAILTPLLDKEQPSEQKQCDGTCQESVSNPLRGKCCPSPEKDVSKGAEEIYKVIDFLREQRDFTLERLKDNTEAYGLVSLLANNTISMLHVKAAFARQERLQARNLVFENNKPVAEHVNETFDGLNNLTEDTEVVWWYKELIVQTVLHFTLQERQKAIEECLCLLDEKIISSDIEYVDGLVYAIEIIRKLKK